MPYIVIRKREGITNGWVYQYYGGGGGMSGKWREVCRCNIEGDIEESLVQGLRLNICK